MIFVKAANYQKPRRASMLRDRQRHRTLPPCSLPVEQLKDVSSCPGAEKRGLTAGSITY